MWAMLRFLPPHEVRQACGRIWFSAYERGRFAASTYEIWYPRWSNGCRHDKGGQDCPLTCKASHAGQLSNFVKMTTRCP